LPSDEKEPPSKWDAVEEVEQSGWYTLETLISPSMYRPLPDAHNTSASWNPPRPLLMGTSTVIIPTGQRPAQAGKFYVQVVGDTALRTSNQRRPFGSPLSWVGRIGIRVYQEIGMVKPFRNRERFPIFHVFVVPIMLPQLPKEAGPRLARRKRAFGCSSYLNKFLDRLTSAQPERSLCR